MEPLALLSIIEELSRMRYEEVWRNRNRQAIRDFWINKLDNRQRLEIIRSEELFLFIKLGEIQNKECECVICDNKRQQLKTDIHLTYKHYLRDLKQFDDQEKSIIACQVLLNTETSRLQMTVNIETKEMFINREENKDTHRQEYYTQISSVFCLFAARMLDRRIIKTYDEALALERQVKLIEEEEQERQRITERKQRKSEHRKDMLNKKRLLKQQEQEKMMEEQREKKKQEAKAKEEKERQSELKRQAKQALREKQKLELEQQRQKSFAKLKKRKERDAMLKKKKNKKSVNSSTVISPIISSPTITCYSHESPTMMSCTSSCTEITASTTDTNEEFIVHDKSDTNRLLIGCFRSPMPVHSKADDQYSLFLHSVLESHTVLEDEFSNQKPPLNKSNIWSNGWHASNSISKDFHHDLFKDAPEKSKAYIIQEAKHVYSVLDKIAFAKYTNLPYCYALNYLFTMMHELSNDDSISMDDLQQALDESDDFVCEMQLPQNVMTVRLTDLY